MTNEIQFPIKGHMLPVHNDDSCPICGANIREGQIIVTFEDYCSITAHFHKEEIFGRVSFNEQTCEVMFCSTTCVRQFFNMAVDAFESKNPKLKAATHKSNNDH